MESIGSIDRWQHLVFAVYHAFDIREDDDRSPLQRVLDFAAKLFPEVDPKADREGYAMYQFVSFLSERMKSEAGL